MGHSKIFLWLWWVCYQYSSSALKGNIAAHEHSFLVANRGCYEVNEAVFLVQLNSSSVSLLMALLIKQSFYVYLMRGDAFGDVFMVCRWDCHSLVICLFVWQKYRLVLLLAFLFDIVIGTTSELILFDVQW